MGRGSRRGMGVWLARCRTAGAGTAGAERPVPGAVQDAPYRTRRAGWPWPPGVGSRTASFGAEWRTRRVSGRETTEFTPRVD